MTSSPGGSEQLITPKNESHALNMIAYMNIAVPLQLLMRGSGKQTPSRFKRQGAADRKLSMSEADRCRAELNLLFSGFCTVAVCVLQKHNTMSPFHCTTKDA